MMQYKRHINFSKQIKKLFRKYRTLEEDLLIAQIAAIELLHVQKIDNNAIKLIPNFDNEKIKIYKLRKFACKALKGKGVRSGIRVIYAFYPESLEVEYLEIYHKESSFDMNYSFAENYFNGKINFTMMK